MFIVESQLVCAYVGGWVGGGGGGVASVLALVLHVPTCNAVVEYQYFISISYIDGMCRDAVCEGTWFNIILQRHSAFTWLGSLMHHAK